jgi:hypothetical protein
VVNNTLYGNDMSNTGSGEFQMQFNMTGNVFENNIVNAGAHCLMTTSKSGATAANRPAVTLDYNLYYCEAGAAASKWGWFPASLTGFDRYLQASGNDRHSNFRDPRFADASRSDFHLRSDSPAIGAGSPQIKGSSRDIGWHASVRK